MRASSPHLRPAFLLALCVASALPIAAQPVLRANRIAEFEIDAMVRDLAMDEFGLIWVATQTGLHRLDGHRVRSWTQSPGGLGHNDVLALHTDATGMLWAGTSGGGLTRIDPASGHARHVAGTDSMFVTRLASDDTSLYLGTWEAGVWRLTGDSLSSVLAGSAGQRVQGLETVDNRLVVVYNSPNVVTVDLRTGAQDTMATGMEPRGFNHLSREGAALVLGSYSPGAILKAAPDPEAPAVLVAEDLSTIYDAVTDAAGRLWIATRVGLRMHADGQTTELAFPREDRDRLFDGRVRALLLDADQYLWIGTDQGLFRASTEQVNLRPERFGGDEEGLAVLATYEDAAGRLWLGTQGQGLMERLPAGGYQDGTTDNGPLSVSAIAEAPAGVLWLGSLGQGLFRFDTRSGGITRLEYACPEDDCIPSNQILGILAEPDALWLTTNGGGLLRFDPQTAAFTRFLPESTNARFQTGLIRRSDELWVGSAGGVLRFTNGTFTTEDTTASDHVLDLYEDSRGHVWATSYGGGLLRWDGQWTRFGEDDGLPEDLVASVAEDGRGRVWTTTLTEQPAVFDEASARFVPIPSQYGVARGASPGGLAGGPSDRLYLAGTGYLSIFEGDALPAPPTPQVLIEEGQGRLYQAEATVPVDGRTGYPLRIVVPSYDPEMQLRCSYRLDGGTWVECGGATTTLSSVRAWPGESRLEVRTAGLGIPESQTWFTVAVLPAWWQTPWMLLIWGGLLVGLAWAGLSQVDRLRRERARRLEARLQRGRQAERDQLASWLHDHSLNDLLGVRHLLEGPGDGGVSQAADRLAEIRQQLRNVCGELQMPALNLGLGAAVVRHLSAFRVANPELRVADRIAPEDDWLGPESRHNMFIAYRTVMANVVRHARAADVEVEWVVTDAEARLRVVDNGEGFDVRAATQRAEAEGRYGLLLAETHLRTVGGRMEVDTAPGRGTAVVLVLRRDRELTL